MHRMLFLLLTVFSLFGISLTTGSQAFAADGPAAAGKMAIQGKLTGSPDLGAVRLVLYAMPPQPVMNKLHVGDHVQGRLVGQATSSSAGSYAIKVSHPEAITSSAFNGDVNLEVWAAGHGYVSLFGFSERVGAGGTLLPETGQATIPMQADLIMHKLSTSHASVSSSAATSGCWVLNTDDGQKWTTLEGLWSTISGVRKFLTYSTNASSSVSIAISTTDGNWTTANTGTTKVTLTGGSQSFPEITGKTSRLGQTEMEVGLFNTCQVSAEVATFPFAVNGGTKYVKSAPPKAKFCVAELKNSKLIMNRTQSVTFADGINLKAAIGLNLSTLTGYTKVATIKYVYTADGFACGIKGAPLRKTAHGVVADAKKSGNK